MSRRHTIVGRILAAFVVLFRGSELVGLVRDVREEGRNLALVGIVVVGVGKWKLGCVPNETCVRVHRVAQRELLVERGFGEVLANAGARRRRLWDVTALANVGVAEASASAAPAVLAAARVRRVGIAVGAAKIGTAAAVGAW